MAIYKRGKKGIYQIEFTAPNGERIRESARTKIREQAQELDKVLQDKYWRIFKLGEKPAKLWEDAVLEWIKEKKQENITPEALQEDLITLRWLDPHLRCKPVSEIDESIINKIKEKRIEAGNLNRDQRISFMTHMLKGIVTLEPQPFSFFQLVVIGKPVSNRRINKVLDVIKKILNRCLAWKWINTVPTIKLLPENQEGWCWIKKEVATQLLKELPLHLSIMAEFSLETGLRKKNVTHLRWAQINFEKKMIWIELGKMKNRTALGIPVSDRGIEILKSQMGKHSEFVFVYEGHPVKQTSTKAWRNAVKRVGIARYRWHDLRHTWASWHVQAGTPLHVLMKLGGWKSLNMVLKYAHFETAHLVQYVPPSQLAQNSDTYLTQVGSDLENKQ